VLCTCIFLILLAAVPVTASVPVPGPAGTGNAAPIIAVSDTNLWQSAGTAPNPVTAGIQVPAMQVVVTGESSSGGVSRPVAAGNQSSILPARTDRVGELRQELVQADLRQPAPLPVFRVAIILIIAFAAVALILYFLFRRRPVPVKEEAKNPEAPVSSATVIEPSPAGRPGVEIPVSHPGALFPPSLEQKYRDPEFIGEGGLARVFRAKRAKDGMVVAVKVPIRYDEATGTHFTRDMTVWQGLHHPNIISIYAANILPVPYIEMEYARSSLAAMKFPINESEALVIVRRVARGLAYAHAHGIVHRDIKPENILITDDGTPKITDWGLARPVADSHQSSVISFSPVYAAPEQIAPGRYGKPGPRTDIYQLGVLLYEMLTGMVPFRSEGLLELNQAILSETPPRPSWAGAHVERIRQIIAKCLAKNPDDRYESVAALIADLDSLDEAG
jgi:hypothetical protein